MLIIPKMKLKAIESKETKASCLQVTLIADRISLRSCILAKIYKMTKEYILI